MKLKAKNFEGQDQRVSWVKLLTRRLGRGTKPNAILNSARWVTADA